VESRVKVNRLTPLRFLSRSSFRRRILGARLALN
jgi:hypothetical protein